jgi:hypothetical protein
MSDRNGIKLDDLCQPGMRRILEAMRQITEEAPGPLDEEVTASIELPKQRDGGHTPCQRQKRSN